MKTFSGFVLVVIALAAQLPRLNAAPADKAVAASPNLMALAEVIICLLPGQTNKEVASLQGFGTGPGFVTDGCSQDFLKLNPELEAIQTFKEQFDIEVSCRTHMYRYGGQLKPCSRVTMKRNFYPFHDVYVDLCDFSDPHIAGECITVANSKCNMYTR